MAHRNWQDNTHQRQSVFALAAIALVLIAGLRLGEVEWSPIFLIAVFVPMIAAAVRHGQKPLLYAHRVLEYQATHDMLTGLPNRVLFNERLRKASQDALCERQCFALILLDLDGFKAVNDGHGHLAGDALLQVVAERLRRNVRAADTVARFGGDEFAVILADVTDKSALLERGQQLRVTLAEPYELVGRHGRFVASVSASIGIALGTGRDCDWLIHSADQALYMAKAAGKNCCISAHGA